MADSRAATCRTYPSVSRAAPITCGAQRIEYASCTRVSSGPRCEATIGESASSRRMLRRRSGQPRVRAQRHQVCGQHPVGAEQRLEAHRGGQVRGPQQHIEVGAGQVQHRQHAVGAVDQREALLLGQHDRGELGLGQHLTCRPRGAAPVPYLALAHDGERNRRQRRQVARAPQRAVLAHDRGDPGVQQVEVGLRGRRSYAGPPGRQRLQPQQRHPAYDLGLDLGAGTRCVRADQAALQLGTALGRDVADGERAEAGGHAVGRRGGCRQAHRPRPARRQPVQAVWREPYPRPCRATATTSASASGAAPTVTQRPRFADPGTEPSKRTAGSARPRRSGRRPDAEAIVPGVARTAITTQCFRSRRSNVVTS